MIAIFISQSILLHTKINISPTISSTSPHFFHKAHEGAIIDELQRIGFSYDGIVLNAGAYTHYSIAIADCIRAITAPVVETHISDVQARETFRHVSMIKDACATMIAGFGLDSYRLAVDWLIEYANEQ